MIGYGGLIQAASGVLERGREESPDGNFFTSPTWKYQVAPMLLSVGGQLLENANTYSTMPTGSFKGVGPAAIQGMRMGQAAQLREKQGALIDESLSGKRRERKRQEGYESYISSLPAGHALRGLGKYMKPSRAAEFALGAPRGGMSFNPQTGKWEVNESWLKAQKDIRRSGRSGLPKAPTTREFYDEKTGRPYIGQYNPTTGKWDRVGGMKALPGPTLPQQANNAEVETARKRILGLRRELRPGQTLRELILERTRKATATGRDNPNYDPTLDNAWRRAANRKVGKDPTYDSFTRELDRKAGSVEGAAGAGVSAGQGGVESMPITLDNRIDRNRLRIGQVYEFNGKQLRWNGSKFEEIE